jgi:hypothetical protein
VQASALQLTPASAAQQTLRCGRPPSLASLPGPAPGAKDGQAGTLSAAA